MSRLKSDMASKVKLGNREEKKLRAREKNRVLVVWLQRIT